MKLVVCIKQVALLGDEIEFIDDGQAVSPSLLDWALNEWDACATEEALRIREAHADGEVVVVSVGDRQADDSLRKCLAMGADRAVRIDVPGGLIDPLTVARLLAGPVTAERPDLVLVGVQSSDSVQSATGPALAGLLELPCVGVVKRLEYDREQQRALVHRELEGGMVDVVEVQTPALLTIQTGINEPRYATLRAIKQAEQKEITVAGAAAVARPGYRVRRLLVPPRGERAEILTGGPAEIAQRIAEIIKERLA